MGTESIETREVTGKQRVEDIQSQGSSTKASLAMSVTIFVKRADKRGRSIEKKQQTAIILSFPAHRDGSRGIVK